MVQKSGGHQLRLIVYLILYIQGFIHPKWLFGMSSISSFNMASREVWIHDHEVFEDPLKEIRCLVFLLKLETMDVFGWETMTDSSTNLEVAHLFDVFWIHFYYVLFIFVMDHFGLTDISSYKKFSPKKIFQKSPSTSLLKKSSKNLFEDLDLFCANL